MDHIILSDETYYSLGENEYMTLIHENSKYKTYEVLKPRLDADKAHAVDRGKKEGLLEGEKNGERNKAVDIAKNLLENNVSVDIIISSTGLTAEDIVKIKKDISINENHNTVNVENVFTQFIEKANSLDIDKEKIDMFIQAINEMKDNANTENFATKYQNFIISLGVHINIFTQLLPLLTEFFKS